MDGVELNCSNLVQARNLPIKAKKKKYTTINHGHIGWYIFGFIQVNEISGFVQLYSKAFTQEHPVAASLSWNKPPQPSVN